MEYYRLADGVRESREQVIQAIRMGNPEIMSGDELDEVGRARTPAEPAVQGRLETAVWNEAQKQWDVVAKPLAEVQQVLITETKNLARTKIEALCPPWKQSNLNMRANQLNWKARPGGPGLTTEEEAEAEALNAYADSTIKPIRDASDTIEAAIAGAADPAAALAAFDAGVWPS